MSINYYPLNQPQIRNKLAWLRKWAIWLDRLNRKDGFD